MSKIIELDDVFFDRSLLLNVLRLFDRENGTCLLYSGGEWEAAQTSFLFLFPFDFISIQTAESSIENPWDILKTTLSFQSNHPYPEWVGFFGYEMGGCSDSQKMLRLHAADSPSVYLQRSAIVIIVDHAKNKGTVVVADQAYYLLSGQLLEWVNYLSDKTYWKDLAQNLSTSLWDQGNQASSSKIFTDETLQTYMSKVEKAKEFIHAGDIYQVNLSQQFIVKGNHDTYTVFRSLVELNPSPFSAYLRLGDMTIVSSSPERFLKKKNNLLETRPIKGTMPRGKNPEEDKNNREALMSSAKNKAELLMITDLMRNDLGKVSCVGSVETPHIQACEAYTNVFHLVSTVRSKALPHLHPIDIFRACFPGGSITGCPKLKAIEVIAELEARPRGIYTGSIGYFAGNGDFDFNIAIRTIVFSEKGIDVQLGGGIVADSDPQNEYEETLHKGQSIFAALGVQFP